MILFGDHDHGFQIAAAAGSAFNPYADMVISRVDERGLLGGAVYQNYTGASIGMHVAGFHADWLNKDLLWVGFHYPFVQLGCQRIFGQVPASNLQALEFDLRLGFKEVTRIDGVFPDGGLIVLAMDRDDCKWLRLRPTGLRAGKEAPDGWKGQGPRAA